MPSSIVNDQSSSAELTTAKKTRGSSVTYAVAPPAPCCSTATAKGRPLIALLIVSSNAPPPGAGGFFVVQRTRSAPVSLVNDSVCETPRPDHDPSECHITSRVVAGVAATRQPAVARKRTTGSARCSRTGSVGFRRHIRFGRPDAVNPVTIRGSGSLINHSSIAGPCRRWHSRRDDRTSRLPYALSLGLAGPRGSPRIRTSSPTSSYQKDQGPPRSCGSFVASPSRIATGASGRVQKSYCTLNFTRRASRIEVGVSQSAPYVWLRHRTALEFSRL